ncbi:MAG TPA: amidohydrolase family protein [Thermoanaerobaculia bacterium]
MGRACCLALVLLVYSGIGAAASPPLFRPGEELRYTVFFGNLHPVGLAVFRVEPGGDSVLTLEVKDRGRGESFTSRLRLDAAGIPLREHLTGVDYWQHPVDEKVEIAGGRASWSGGPEKGEKKIARAAFYVTRGGLSMEAGLLAMALLHNPHHRLPLLPEGEGRLEKVGAARIAGGGKARDLTLYLLTGLSAPIYVWMDGDGVFFGRYDGFVTSVPQGWEDAAPAMIKAQLEAAGSRWKVQAAKLSHRPSGALALKGARLFDPEAGTVTPNVTVVISGNRIQAVGPDGQVAVPAGAQVIDAHGRMLLPGLWDMHQHFTEDDGLLDLAAGVTTGRDMANDMDYLLDLKQKWESGDALGPRVVLAGVIEGPGPYASPTKVLVDTEEKARAAVDHYVEKGYAQIKIYSSLDPKLVPGIVAEAHRLGRRVSGHIPNGMTAADAVREGYDEIQHVNFLFLNFIPGVDTRTMARMTAVGEHAAGIDLTSEPVREFIRLLKERHTVVDPTLNIYEDLFTARDDKLRPSLAPVADRLPYQVRRTLFGGSLAIPPDQEQRYRDSYRACVAMVRLLHDEGIPIEAGTDSLAGFDLHRELELYVQEVGIPAPEVLRIATLGAARVMKLDHDLGTIAPGKLADMILVDGDPTKNISDIRRVVLTVKDGMMYDPAKLYRSIGVKPAV